MDVEGLEGAGDDGVLEDIEDTEDTGAGDGPEADVVGEAGDTEEAGVVDVDVADEDVYAADDAEAGVVVVGAADEDVYAADEDVGAADAVVDANVDLGADDSVEVVALDAMASLVTHTVVLGLVLALGMVLDMDIHTITQRTTTPIGTSGDHSVCLAGCHTMIGQLSRPPS